MTWFRGFPSSSSVSFSSIITQAMAFSGCSKQTAKPLFGGTFIEILLLTSLRFEEWKIGRDEFDAVDDRRKRLLLLLCFVGFSPACFLSFFDYALEILRGYSRGVDGKMRRRWLGKKTKGLGGTVIRYILVFFFVAVLCFSSLVLLYA